MKSHLKTSLLLTCAAMAGLSTLPLNAQPAPAASSNASKTLPGIENFKKYKYGFFVHYVWGGNYRGMTRTKIEGTGKEKGLGAVPASIDALADDFDAQKFADDLASWGVEYVIFTAYHANINPLFPSETMKKWGLANHTPKRDLIGDMIKAVKAKGIAVLLYTHPRDGHDLRGDDGIKTGWGPAKGIHPTKAFDKEKWNNFTAELYTEIVNRYGKDLAGIYIDEGSSRGNSDTIVDYARLRDIIKKANPNLIMIHNFFGNIYTCDIGDKEYHHGGPFKVAEGAKFADGSQWPSNSKPLGIVFDKTWWAEAPEGVNTVTFTPEDMFRFTVLQASANTDGGGVQWAAGPYPGGGWETGVDETMKKVWGYIQPIAESIKSTFPSKSYVTKPGKKISDLTWGVATRSVDDKYEYIHVLKAPESKTLTLPAPADGKKFATATLLPAGTPVELKQDASGVKLTLGAKDNWSPLNTVIRLNVTK